MKSQMHTRKFRNHRSFIRDSDARNTVGGEEAARHYQNPQMNSLSSLGITAGDLRCSAHAAESSMAQAQCVRPIRAKYSRASHRKRQPAANLTTLMTGVWRLMKAYAILWQKLYARFSERIFDQGHRVLASGGATRLDVGDRVSMQTGRLSRIPSRPTQSQHAPSEFAHCPRQETAATHVTEPQTSLPCRRINGGSSELQII
jgi:hypothetical protein